MYKCIVYTMYSVPNLNLDLQIEYVSVSDDSLIIRTFTGERLSFKNTKQILREN